jgi:hypothetical protein
MRARSRFLRTRNYAFAGLLSAGLALILSFQNCAQNYKLKVSDATFASEEAYAYYQGSDSDSNFILGEPVAAGQTVHFLISDSSTTSNPANGFFAITEWDLSVAKKTYVLSTSIHPSITALPGGASLYVFYLKVFTDDGAVNETVPLVVFASSSRPALTATLPASVTTGSIAGLQVGFSSATVGRMKLRVTAVETPSGPSNDFSSISDFTVPIGSTSVTIPMPTVRGTPRASRSYTVTVKAVSDDNAPTTSTSVTIQD